MLKPLLNTLYVEVQGSYLRLDHETLRLEVERKLVGQVPLQHIGSAVVFGNVLVSPFLLHRFGEDGRSLVWMTRNGRFKCRLSGPVTGNVLLRKAQYDAQADPALAFRIARNIVAGKVRNGRTVVQRAARETDDPADRAELEAASSALAASLRAAGRARSLDEVRGVEGRAGRVYFDVFGRMVRTNRDVFQFNGRNRRPPRDRINALLSFVYALVRGDCVSACEGVGLDPQFGYLHALRSGRPALALDLMEELRPVLADRLVLALINLAQLTDRDFDPRPGGSVNLTESGRKTVLVAYQTRKAREVHHPVVGRSVPLGLVPHLQARLLARHLRGDSEAYLPFTPR
ncbi:CRISPR-associated endonuclease Cas1, subtype I-C/DVULG [Rubrobacter radiotolerans]|uniref:CRISPR-associated endonuclease Cas1 n=1 Tax=Rubrobacter radiotolerans TaxID=42256 RepID=A0A023X2Y1_RUBRA|nr:type I-C CRISPR-associated endonuclease Cas1c [Rubrobacter radiotolerans]AHY46365.1 CRISPR-associated endonuclease Cas1, subtype I-C/DVULG [Rubrobacter radiotolerans]MDX5893772.1 type I-C CRISPR-associated endonuclease Cas1c [Rubrobacter radiotolerans]SMC04470.1 CRISP-associated protein Cas1 [Rubrobacter radiotolerans DSM 5868]